MAKKGFMNKKWLLTGNWDMPLKKRIIKCTVWIIALYGAEIWTMTRVD